MQTELWYARSAVGTEVRGWALALGALIILAACGDKPGPRPLRGDSGEEPPEIDAGMTGGCRQGTHLCGATCADSKSPASCGVSCTPCPPPMGGTATCDGTSCGAACPAGKKLCVGACIGEDDACVGVCRDGTHNCGGNCVPNTSVNSCGKSCLPCPTPPNGAAACENGFCAVTCQTGYHACDLTCASNTSPESCGTMCEPCPAPMDGVASCLAGKCGLSCPGKVLCGNVCLDATKSCGGMCPAGKHDCNGACVSDTDPANCGKSCAPCPAPMNGTASCNGTACTITCKAGFHQCGAACLADSSPDSCGKSCTACPAPGNGTATCANGACGVMCGAGFHACGTDCADNKNPATCGDRCVVCDTPDGAHPTCDGRVCSHACNFNTFACADRTCVPQRWDFELLSVDGWQLGPGTTVQAMPTRAFKGGGFTFSGFGAVAVDFTATATGQTLFVQVPLCAGGTDVSGKTLTARMTLRGPVAVDSAQTSAALVNITDASGTMSAPLGQVDNVKVNDWPQPQVVFPAGTTSFKIGILLKIGFAAAPWTGTLYFDAINFR
jgi:hypothetical protein